MSPLRLVGFCAYFLKLPFSLGQFLGELWLCGHRISDDPAHLGDCGLFRRGAGLVRFREGGLVRRLPTSFLSVGFNVCAGGYDPVPALPFSAHRGEEPGAILAPVFELP